MFIDKFGQIVLSENDILEIYYKDPDKKLKSLTETKIDFSDELEIAVPKLQSYNNIDISVDDFDRMNQNNWLMPEKYKDMDIAKFVLDQCKTEEELQRAGKELLMFQDRDMFTLLKYLKYLVDTMKSHNILYGVGRGSSVSSFVLYIIGIHRINSLYYDLDIEEFLK